MVLIQSSDLMKAGKDTPIERRRCGILRGSWTGGGGETREKEKEERRVTRQLLL